MALRQATPEGSAARCLLADNGYESADPSSDAYAASVKRACEQLTKQAAVYGADPKRAAFQLATTLALFALSLFAISEASRVSVWISLALALPAAGLLVRLFIIQHDCGHGSFFRSRRANDAVGRALSLLTLTPYGAWRRDHVKHHASSGNLDRRGHGDVTTLTVLEYQALRASHKLGYRLYRNPFVMVLVGAPVNFIILQRFAVGQSFKDRGGWRSVASLNLALVAMFGSAMLVFGVSRVLFVYSPVMIIASWFGNWLFYVQHQYEGTYWQRQKSWDVRSAALQGGSYFKLPRILQWFSGNIGLHHVHHLSSRIPNYRLQACLDDNPTLARLAVKISLTQSFSCWRLGLWDEASSKLVPFKDAR